MGILDKITKKSAADEKQDEKKQSAKAQEPKSTKDSAKKADDKVKKPAAKKVEANKEEKKADKKAVAAKKATASLFAFDIIREPVLTEKGDRGQMQGKYTFYVSRDANKVEIARAISELYGVQPVSVRVLNVKGKAVRFGRRTGTRKNRRKAVVTLKQGDSISVTE